MFNSFARRISRRLGNVLKFLSPDEVDDNLLEREKNLYKRDIIRESRNIEMFDNDLISPAALAKSIDKIGCLAYTGGPPANKCAGEYISKFAELLSRPDLRSDLKIAILKSLSTITVNHADHQNACFREGLLRTVGDIIVKSTEGLRLWAVYCLHCLVLDNIRSLQAVKEDVTIHEGMKIAASANWKGFCHNYADMLLKLAGLFPVKLIQKRKDPSTLIPPSPVSGRISSLSGDKTENYHEKKTKICMPRSKLAIINEND